MRIGRGNWSTRRKTAPVSLYPPQTTHDLTWDRTRDPEVGSRWLTAWAMAWHMFVLLLWKEKCSRINEEINFQIFYIVWSFIELRSEKVTQRTNLQSVTYIMVKKQKLLSFACREAYPFMQDLHAESPSRISRMVKAWVGFLMKPEQIIYHVASTPVALYAVFVRRAWNECKFGRWCLSVHLNVPMSVTTETTEWILITWDIGEFTHTHTHKSCISGDSHFCPYQSTLLRSWLRHYSTSRKVAGLIPDEVIEFLNWLNPSNRTIAERSARNLPGCKRRPARKADIIAICELII
jgi:hypothetical protein